MKEITLTNGAVTLVDNRDYAWLSQWKWSTSVSGTRFYASGQMGGEKRKRMHRIILNAPKGMEVDHINGRTLDNRRCNLRICSRQENSRNSSVNYNSASGYKGVTRRLDRDHDTWQARITLDGKGIYLGEFTCKVEAAKAYDRKAKELHGEFARLNFPEEVAICN